MKYLLSTTAVLAALGASHAQTGRQLDIIAVPTETQVIDGTEFGVAPIVGIFWDERCASVEYTYNTAGAPNAAFGAPISADETVAIIQTGLDRWNANPASFIELNVTEQRDLGDRPRVAGDFINEVTFVTAPGFGALASSPSTSLSADSTFNAGDDLDLDGDSDVFDPAAEGRNTCFDADGDGDIEFPAGDYKAGTILDNDVQFSSTVLWETEPTASTAADIDAVSTHEFGHSHGLNHALINQISDEDGTSSTMFPFIDTGDPQAELATRELHTDDLAVSAFIYPEGSSRRGIAAIQRGDKRFNRVYDVIRGEVTDGEGTNILGAAITATNREGRRSNMTYSGRSAAFELPGVGLFAFPEGALSGEYELVVARRQAFALDMQALDGDPAAAGNISTNAIIGDILGQTNFPEEGWSSFFEDDRELRPDLDGVVYSSGYFSQKVDFVLNEEGLISNNDGTVNFIGTGAIFGATSLGYAEVFDGEAVLAALDGSTALVSGNIRTGTLDASLPVQFDRLRLSVGRVNEETGALEVVKDLQTVRKSFGQDSDTAPVVFNSTLFATWQAKFLLQADPTLDLILIAEADNLVAGPSGFPPAFVAIDNETAPGSSFLSVDGADYAPLGSGVWLMDIATVSAAE
ncbi:matrixin family metalloprotease [Parvularcula maris]|uniref:Matrixin family metalloprotease n=1 Tax=Parvularcula maris TaxID=2965077 RepID=A0A9X2RGP3_9PROT|nr:matrixin family metalloprotease [Parvularcula maris]MCQ8184140.1 matrixin family metalloprotease [Parvularcula maris]